MFRPLVREVCFFVHVYHGLVKVCTDYVYAPTYERALYRAGYIAPTLARLQVRPAVFDRELVTFSISPVSSPATPTFANANQATRVG